MRQFQTVQPDGGVFDDAISQNAAQENQNCMHIRAIDPIHPHST